MMMPGLTEEECQRYQELLEIRCQYERHNEKQQREAKKNESNDVEAEVKEQEETKEAGQEALPSSLVVDVNCNATLSEHEMALIEEELRHLEFKCRNILRAQKMQQLRERCLKAWMMEEETVAAGAGRPGPPEAGNHDNSCQVRKSTLFQFMASDKLWCCLVTVRLLGNQRPQSQLQAF